MCQLFAAYVRKTARLRDKADLMVREISLYADTETPNLKKGIKQFADQLAKIQDYRQAEVCSWAAFIWYGDSYQGLCCHFVYVVMTIPNTIIFLQVERLEARVVEPLKSYGPLVKLKRVSRKEKTDFWMWCVSYLDCPHDGSSSLRNIHVSNADPRYLAFKMWSTIPSQQWSDSCAFLPGGLEDEPERQEPRSQADAAAGEDETEKPLRPTDHCIFTRQTAPFMGD